MKLSDFLAQNPRLAVAFSGGVDSSYLLYAAKAAGCDVKGYFIRSQFQPPFELQDARRLCEELGVSLHVEDFDILANPDVAKNPADRCYFCKKALFTRLWALARADGYTLMCDGSNASDDEGDRPGMRALAQLGVVSPLRESGLTKGEIRRLSFDAGLFTHDKPAYACLATRIPSGTPITGELLSKVLIAEEALFDLGFTDFRVRFFHGAARIQLPEGQLARAFLERNEILNRLSPFFLGILLDLQPR